MEEGVVAWGSVEYDVFKILEVKEVQKTVVLKLEDFNGKVFYCSTPVPLQEMLKAKPNAQWLHKYSDTDLKLMMMKRCQEVIANHSLLQ